MIYTDQQHGGSYDMDVTGLSEQGINDLEQELLSRIPQKESIGNKNLIKQLKWDESLYFSIRNRLLQKGEVEKGRGKGGSIRRVGIEDVVDDPVVSPPPNFITREADLYEPIAKVLSERWAQEAALLDQFRVEITAKQGARETGGKWSRPDITLASCTAYPYVPGKHLDIITFEVKPCSAIDVTAVYEALAHRRAATQSYVIFNVPQHDRDIDEGLLTPICDEAKQHGIGVIVCREAGDYETWVERTSPTRHQPDPQLLNDFIAKQLSQPLKDCIIKWFR